MMTTGSPFSFAFGGFCLQRFFFLLSSWVLQFSIPPPPSFRQSASIKIDSRVLCRNKMFTGFWAVCILNKKLVNTKKSMALLLLARNLFCVTGCALAISKSYTIRSLVWNMLSWGTKKRFKSSFLSPFQQVTHIGPRCALSCGLCLSMQSRNHFSPRKEREKKRSDMVDDITTTQWGWPDEKRL